MKHVELIAGTHHSYRWRLVAADGEILATAVPQVPVVDDADNHTQHRRASCVWRFCSIV